MTVVRLMLVAMLMLPAVGAEASGIDLQAMIDSTPPGSTLLLPPGTYRGGVVIDKPIEIRGDGWPVIDGGGDGVVVTVDAPDVTLTGLVITNSGDSLDREDAGISANAPRVKIIGNRLESVLFGIFLRQAQDSVIAGNDVGALAVEVQRRGDGIRVWESPRTLIEGNTVDGGRDTVLWFSDDLIVRDNVFSNGRYGVHFMYSHGALVEQNHLTGNSVGGFLMYSKDVVLKSNLITNNQGPSGYGVGLKEMDGITIVGNHILGNRVGLYFDNSPSAAGVTHDIVGNLFAYNDIGAQFLPSVKGNVFVGNSFIDKREQVGVKGSGDFEGNNTFTVDGLGNHWSDFAGYDADADGVGDISYELADLFSAFTDDNPDLHFFDGTPAARAVDLAGHMFPAFRPRPKVTDTAPLVEPPSIPSPIPAPPSGSSLSTGLAALAMAGLALAMWSVAKAPIRRGAR